MGLFSNKQIVHNHIEIHNQCGRGGYQGGYQDSGDSSSDDGVSGWLTTGLFILIIAAVFIRAVAWILGIIAEAAKSIMQSLADIAPLAGLVVVSGVVVYLIIKHKRKTDQYFRSHATTISVRHEEVKPQAQVGPKSLNQIGARTDQYQTVQKKIAQYVPYESRN